MVLLCATDYYLEGKDLEKMEDNLDTEDNVEEKRNFIRFDYPTDSSHSPSEFFISVPELSDEPLHPEDFSTGGFKINLPKCPRIGDKCTCTINLYDITLSGLDATVVHIFENQSDTPSWSVGLSINIGNDERDHLASLMMAFINGEHEIV